MATVGRYVVALLGVSGSGKAIVSGRLRDHHGLARIRFGDPQRDMMKAGFGLTDAEIDGPDRGRPVDRFGHHTPKHMVSSLSHAWGRGMIHAGVWDREWERRVALSTGGVVVDDVYRQDEADTVRAAGGVVVRVVRPGHQPRISDDRTAGIRADAELTNLSVDGLIAETDALVATLRAALARIAA